MDKYYIALFDSDWHGESYSRGDIVTAAPGAGPYSGAWANFEPPEGLSGEPKLASIDDPGSGNLTFHYILGTQGKGLKGFCIKARIGMPCAHVEAEEPWSVHEGPPPSKKTEKAPKLEYGAGLVASAGRSFVGFVSKSGLRAAPVKKSTIFDDPLHYDNGYDPLRRGLED